MLLHGFIKLLYDFGNWLYKVAYLHFLWLLFTALGFVIFGITPATTALFAILHSWFERDIDKPTMKHFFSIYKEKFKVSNGLGVVLLLIGGFLYFDISISHDYIQSFYLHSLLLIISSFYIIILLYIFPILSRYNLKFHQYVKQAFLIALAQPLETIAMIISLILLFYFFSYLPIMLFFAGSSIIATPLMWLAKRACVLVEKKQTNE
ncbi:MULTISPECIES: YesL family protein [Virgibacillus]|uniref:DUF624 domain-containing protein n=2 Tax=Virgibacillus TaxID=84406 RepID=A0ABQ2DBM3_9BACI|nr:MULTISPECIES: DUF624 domain-containing protein [Virgibacillus]EQB38097.1 hypothetical protein M948_05860 [Virgibacillus sp. CM-4]GGJ51993.1 hypothetical protein GCM10007111_12660 [Virgibacillus kapii]CDQ38391.1 putative integral membrane protein [Virgibacillus massiliensis]